MNIYIYSYFYFWTSVCRSNGLYFYSFAPLLLEGNLSKLIKIMINVCAARQDLFVTRAPKGYQLKSAIALFSPDCGFILSMCLAKRLFEPLFVEATVYILIVLHLCWWKETCTYIYIYTYIYIHILLALNLCMWKQPFIFL